METGSDAADKGILPGDVLLALDGTYLTAVEDLQSALYSYNALEGSDFLYINLFTAHVQYSRSVGIGFPGVWSGE